jgi:hypothetical protein
MAGREQRFTGKRYFEIQPFNNVTDFAFSSGQNVIRFQIPPMNSALLNDVLFCGNLQVNTDAATPYDQGDIVADPATSKMIGVDSTNGIHSFIQRVEISTRRGAMMLQENTFYDLNSKKENASKNAPVDLLVGRNNCMNFQSSRAVGSMRRLTRDAIDDNGVPFAVNLEMGLLNKSNTRIALDKVGGLEMLIYLNSDTNALFNINNNLTTKLTSAARYTLRNVRIFGSYQMINPAVAGEYQGVAFKMNALNLQTLNSSLDTNGFVPQVQAMDKIVYIAQPNTTSQNNFATNAQSTDMLVGQKSYKVSLNGTPFPMDFSVKNETAVPNIPAAASVFDGQITGNPEAIYHLCLATQNKYPPYHTCISAELESESMRDAGDSVAKSINNVSPNFQPIAVNYQHGFDGYASPMTQSLVQTQFDSSVQTNDPHVDAEKRGQAQTLSAIYEFNASLDYSSLMLNK